MTNDTYWTYDNRVVIAPGKGGPNIIAKKNNCLMNQTPWTGGGANWALYMWMYISLNIFAVFSPKLEISFWGLSDWLASLKHNLL